jgi:sortase A
VLRGAGRRGAAYVPVSWSRRDEVSTATRTISWTIGALAGLCLWVVVFGLFLSGLSESHAQHSLYANFRTQLAKATAPTGGAIADGAPVALLSAPGAGLDDVVVVQGTSSADLRLGPGLEPGLPLPGQAGVSLVMARSTSYGGPFADITHLRVGDTITATTGQGVFHYQVRDVRFPGDPLPSTVSGGSQLTLVTSDGGGWRSGWAPAHAVFVDALLEGRPALSPGVGTAPSSADQVLAPDTGNLYPMILWLQLLLVAVVAAVWAAVRWGRWQTWLIATPVLLAALWGATSSAWLLLPNIL